MRIANVRHEINSFPRAEERVHAPRHPATGALRCPPIRRPPPIRAPEMDFPSGLEIEQSRRLLGAFVASPASPSAGRIQPGSASIAICLPISARRRRKPRSKRLAVSGAPLWERRPMTGSRRAWPSRGFHPADSPDLLYHRQFLYDFQNSCHNAVDRRVMKPNPARQRWDSRRARKRRTKTAVKLLKTNDPAKSPDFAVHNFNGLGLWTRSPRFRSAKSAARFHPDNRRLRVLGCVAKPAGA